MNIDKLVEATNVCDLLDDEQIKDIGVCALEGYTKDKSSRAEWEEKNAAAMNLALQVAETKSFPWVGAANIKFPLVTVAAMQYAARAYPALINENDLVKAKVYGADPDFKKTQLAERISAHMTWQNIEQDLGWEEEHDKLLLVQAIIGCAFIKRTFEPGHGKQLARLVLPANFVVDYYARDIQHARRYTETFYYNRNNIHQRVMDGRFRKDSEEATRPDDGQQNDNLLILAKDERQGIRRQDQDEVTPYFTGEQYCWLDLDDDGYEEPYIVTFDINSGYVYRIVARYLPSGITRRNGDVYKIVQVDVYTKYPFIPSPDGGFYDLGLGALVGPINESVNTALNQLFDASTMKTLGGGFLGRGFKGKGGAFTFAPGEWKPVDAPGDDLRKSIMSLPVPDPPQIMFQIIGFLVNYAERIVSSTEMQVGENVGQNTPAETARTMDENGRRVYSAIYKRTWRAFRSEYRIQAQLNALFLEVDKDYEEISQGNQPMVLVDDYRTLGIYIKPAADPHVISDQMRVQQAQMLVQNAMSLPGHNKYKALLRLYKAMQVPGIDEIMPPPTTQGPDGKPQPAADFPPMPNPKMMEIQVKQAQQQLKEKEFQSHMMEMKITLQLEAQETAANINKLNAQATKLLAEAKGAEVEPQIKMIFASIEAEGKRQERVLKLVDTISTHMQEPKNGSGASGSNAGTGMARVEAPPANAAVPQVAVPGQGFNGAGMVQ